MVRQELGVLIQGFTGRRVMVLGDMVLDEYVMGRPSRISREAPVLILQYSGSFVRPGGATNTANNLSRLGAKTIVVGVVGDDQIGRALRAKLDELAIDTSCLLIDPNRPTSTKTRVVAKGTQQEVQQQIVRIDRVDGSAIPAALRNQMIDTVRHSLDTLDALVVSDYESGVISQELIEACLPRARRQGVTVVVDSHGDLFRFKGVTAATPNQPEAAATLNRNIETEADLDQAGVRLLAIMEADAILITRGSEGIALYERGRQPYKLPVAVPTGQDVIDPTGAGDTVAAVFTLAVTAGASMRRAAYLANLAGGEVVRRLGAATVTQDDLQLASAATTLPVPG